MKWKPRKGSGDIEDRRASGGRGRSGGLPGLGSGGLPIPLPRGKGGLVTLLVMVIAYFVIGKGVLGGSGGGFDITDVLKPPATSVPATGTGDDSVPGAADPDDRTVEFVKFVVGDNQDMWAQVFTDGGRDYSRAKLVLFRGNVNSGCGGASAAVGPFYCPLDEKAYIDLSFFDELNRRFKAPGDFAQAYVLAHEIGHHVQQELGIEEQVRRESGSNPDQANALSVRLELQADCMAGIWARSTYERGILEEGDLEEGLIAAAAVGDDRIQEQAGGRIEPENFTHGTSKQRQRWLRRGYDRGNLEACDTFQADNL